ncbi:DUF1109 domain-containing protein [Sphingomonas mali]|uniref:DUF1109 domain-containing protein n=1 Tax=Sphingomonas mali TaxID=40682 RepID=UPI000831B2D9|nr:DUF1109 domain-containing protein [Sphingomonas mali]
MTTDDLIAQLSGTVAPVSRRAVGERLARGLLLGAIVSAAVMAAGLGLRPDLGAAIHGSIFWMKAAYTMSLAALALTATRQLARPDAGSIRWLWLATLPVLLLAVVGVADLSGAPSSAWLALWLGKSWRICPWLILALSVPVFLGLLWSFRSLAPTRLRATGATAGLASGAFAATIYCLHCPEASAMFVLTWYSLGILLATAIGALLGPRLLRW